VYLKSHCFFCDSSFGTYGPLVHLGRSIIHPSGIQSEDCDRGTGQKSKISWMSGPIQKWEFEI
jgi:hypothetical protein